MGHGLTLLGGAHGAGGASGTRMHPGARGGGARHDPLPPSTGIGCGIELRVPLITTVDWVRVLLVDVLVTDLERDFAPAATDGARARPLPPSDVVSGVSRDGDGGGTQLRLHRGADGSRRPSFAGGDGIGRRQTASSNALPCRVPSLPLRHDSPCILLSPSFSFCPLFCTLFAFLHAMPSRSRVPLREANRGRKRKEGGRRQGKGKNAVATIHAQWQKRASGRTDRIGWQRPALFF